MKARFGALRSTDVSFHQTLFRGGGAGVPMKQISVRWGDLGSPVQPGTYYCGPHMVEVTPGDIQLAEGNPDAVFTAIHPDFYPADYPYLLTGVERPTKF